MSTRKKLKTADGSFATVDGDEDKVLPHKTPGVKHESSLSLLDMNDDCLREILTRLEVMDMFSISNSCYRLKLLAFELFQRKKKIWTLNFSFTASVNTQLQATWTLNFPLLISADAVLQARQMFQSFGAYIVKLEMNFLRSKKRNNILAVIMDAVVQHCTGIKSMTLQGFNIPENEFFGMKRLFKRLETLHLVHVHIQGLNDYDDDDYSFYLFMSTYFPSGNSINLFNDCPSLMELNLYDSSCFHRPIFESLFPKLERFTVTDQCDVIDENTEEFILNHPKLKAFDVNCEECHLPFLAENRNDIQRVGFGNPDFGRRSLLPQSLESLAKFRSLRELKCECIGGSLVNVLELPNLPNSLEVLDLSFGHCTLNSIQLILELKKLHTIRLFDIYITENIDGEKYHPQHPQIAKLIVDIVHRLANLTILALENFHFQIQKETYLQLVEIVESRLASNRHLVIDCRTTDDFKHLLRSTVEIAEIKLN